MMFRDRTDAGRRLGRRLSRYRDEQPLVLGLPRGGVSVAYEVARALEAELDVWVVRKIGAPFQPELGLGAVAEGGELFVDEDNLGLAGVTREEVTEIATRQAREVARQVTRFRGDRPPPEVAGRTVIVADDGVATGGTMRAVVRALRKRGPKRLVLATPVAASDTLRSLRPEVDEMVCLDASQYLGSIGAFYLDFSQVTDDEVVKLLERAREALREPKSARASTEDTRAPGGGIEERGAGRGGTEEESRASRVGIEEGGAPLGGGEESLAQRGGGEDSRAPRGGSQESRAPRGSNEESRSGRGDVVEKDVLVRAGEVTLEGTLSVPENAVGLVIFVHGSGSSRKSPRNLLVAEHLRAAGLGTLLFDLLTPEEGAEDTWTARFRFDIGLLTTRLLGATDWAVQQPETRHLRIGYFGASTGAAAALAAAAMRPDVVGAVVSRGGRPDLAERFLPRVQAPTLLIVGGEDPEVLELNEQAFQLLRAPRHLAVVPGATHLFEEPGALEEVAHLAAEWFVEHLAQPRLEATG